MAVTDSTILTGTINICTNKYAENGPEYKYFYPKTESAQIVDFDAATKEIIDARVSNYTYGNNGTIKATNLNATNNLAVTNSTNTKSLTVSNNANVTNTLTAKDIISTNSIIVQSGTTTKIKLDKNGTITASLSGNAATASKLYTTRSIDGIKFSGELNIHRFGICNTAATTQEKIVTFVGDMATRENDFILTEGAIVAVRFTVENNSASPKLKIGTNASYPIYYRGTNIPTKAIKANSTYVFIFNDNKFYIIGDLDAYYTTQLFASTSDGTSNANTSNTNTFLRLIEKDNINAVHQTSSIQITGSDATSVSSSNGKITITSSNNKVEQNNSIANNAYPVLLKNGTGNGKITDTILFNSMITINPSTSTLTVTNLNGNATSATKLQTARNITVSDSTAANIGVATSFNGTSNINIKLPGTITATVKGNADTATKVMQTSSIVNSTYPILFSATANKGSNSNDSVIFNKNITINPSTNVIKATKFDGLATKAEKDSSNQTITSTYIKNIQVSGQTITYTKGDGTTGTLATQDTLVTQNMSTTNAEYPLLATPTAKATANQGAKTVVFGKGIRINPSTSTIYATTFNGSATNAVNATNAQYASEANLATRALYDDSDSTDTTNVNQRISKKYATKQEVEEGYMPAIESILITLQEMKWTNNTDANTKTKYPKCYVIENNSISADDIVDVVIGVDTSKRINYTSVAIAMAAGLAPYVESGDKKFTLLAKTTPGGDINIVYRIYKGVATSGSVVQSKVYMPKVVSNTFTINNWTNNDNANFGAYLYKYTNKITGISANDIVNVFYNGIITPTSEFAEQVRTKSICPVVLSKANGIDIYSNVKYNNISLGYQIFKGTTNTTEALADTTAYMPKVYQQSAATVITASNWTATTVAGTDIKWQYIIPNTSTVTTDIVEIIVDPSSKTAAENIKINSVANVSANQVIIYCESPTKPTVNINVWLYIYHGTATEIVGNNQNYMLKKKIQTINLATTGWTTNNVNLTNGYNWVYKIKNTTVTNNDIVDLIINHAGQKIAYKAKMCPVVETINEYIYLYSVLKPTSAITAEYYIYQGSIQ